MAVTLYTNASGGAPSYTDAAGSLIGVLDYCLVTGQGWTKTVLASNQASYQNRAAGNGYILQVDDSAATGSLATVGVSGWKTLTAFNTGTGEFVTGGATVYRATSGSGVTWRLVTNGTLFHFTANVSSSATDFFSFGDYTSYIYGDASNTMIGAYSGAVNSLGWMGNQLALTLNTNTGVPFQGAPTGWNQSSVAAAAAMTAFFDSSHYVTAVTGSGLGGTTYPDPISGNLNVSPVWVCDKTAGITPTAAFTLRGSIPGVLFLLHALPFSDGDTVSVTGVQGFAPANMTSRTYLVVGGQAAGKAQCLIETSNTWGGY